MLETTSIIADSPKPVSCHRYFEHYENLGEFQDLELLDHLGEAMLLSDRLTFLGLLLVTSFLSHTSVVWWILVQVNTGNFSASMEREILWGRGSC